MQNTLLQGVWTNVLAQPPYNETFTLSFFKSLLKQSSLSRHAVLILLLV